MCSLSAVLIYNKYYKKYYYYFCFYYNCIIMYNMFNISIKKFDKLKIKKGSIWYFLFCLILGRFTFAIRNYILK